MIAGVEHAHARHRGGEGVHRVAALGEVLQHVDDAELQPAFAGQLSGELLELGRVGQTVEEQEVDGLFIRAALGELLDGVAPVLKLPHASIDETDARLRAGDPGQARDVLGFVRHETPIDAICGRF